MIEWPRAKRDICSLDYYSGFRIRKARVRKCNRFPRQKGGHGPRGSKRRLRKLATRTRHCSLVTEFSVSAGRKLWQVSRLMRSSSSYILESQPGKLMLETFSWDNIYRGTNKNRQSMTSCGFCCYYLEHCSKTNHIAIKWTKYENVYGLVASHKIWWSPNFLRLGNLRDANKTSGVWNQSK